MPTYCFYCDPCRHRFEASMPMRELRDECCPLCGGVAGRDFGAEQGHVRGGRGNWPMESYAVGVGEDQVADAEAESRELGVPTHFNPETGDAQFTDASHRKRYCDAKGYVDRNAGYSDPQGK